MHISLHEELRSHFRYIAKSIETIVYIYHLLHRNYYISYCLSFTITWGQG